MEREPLDMLALGEVLVDMISTDEATTLNETPTFEMHLGGSPTNLARNIVKLGGRAALVAKVGDDAFGQFARAQLDREGVSTEYLNTSRTAHTSVVFVTHTQGTPDFLPLREADCRVGAGEVPDQAILRARAVHASSWALSYEPFRSIAIHALKMAHMTGKLVTFDPNYSPKIWPNVHEARYIHSLALPYVDIIKPSMDDVRRLFGAQSTPEYGIMRYHEMGVPVIVITMGAQGALLYHNDEVCLIGGDRNVKVVDATGAGDAFWAGFVLAKLDGYDLATCVRVGHEVAARKLDHVGPLPKINRYALYRDMELERPQPGPLNLELF